jgi:hypothetical protein
VTIGYRPRFVLPDAEFISDMDGLLDHFRAQERDGEQQIGGPGGSLEPPWASFLNPLGLFLDPLGLFLRTSIPVIWRILSAFLRA